MAAAHTRSAAIPPRTPARPNPSVKRSANGPHREAASHCEQTITIMGTFIAWLAIAAVLYFVYFIVKRVLRFLFRWGKSGTPFHDELADVAEDVAAASRVAAVLSSIAAFLVAPVGLMAIGAALGVVSVPLIVHLAPILIALAVGAAALSAAAKLYAKARRRKGQGRRGEANPQ